MRLDPVAVLELVAVAVFLAVVWSAAMRKRARTSDLDKLPSWKRYGSALIGCLVGLGIWHLLTQTPPGASDLGMLVAGMLGSTKAAQAGVEAIRAWWR